VSRSAPENAPGASKAEAGSLGQRAYQTLRRALRDGVIQPGRLYSESEFAELLGVSRTPVREALKALEREGVLEAARNRGYRLRTFSDAELDEFAALRCALERLTVTTFVKTATDRDLKRLDDILRRQDRDTRGEEIFALDEEFHLTIADLAGLHYTREILAGLRSVVAVVMAGASVSIDDTRQRVYEHHAILDALRSRDATAATRLMDRHIEGASRALIGRNHNAPPAIMPLRPQRAPA
jgi:GntR family transcriptional regulator, rspAB operon transcriptional repressor